MPFATHAQQTKEPHVERSEIPQSGKKNNFIYARIA
jgi:hypothetical protein